MARAISRALKYLSPFAGSIGVTLFLATAATWGLVALHGHGVEQGRAEIRKEITAPVSGWAARLATCNANNGALQAGVVRQNNELNKQRDEDAKRLGEAADAVSAAALASKDTARKIETLNKPLRGVDTCARMLEVDERVKDLWK